MSSFIDCSPRRNATTLGLARRVGLAGPTSSCCSIWYLATWSCNGCAILVKAFSRLPDSASRGFARVLDAATAPFDVINYYGSCAASVVYNRHRMGAKMDRVIASLQRKLARESDETLRRGMHFPTRWDPFFKDYMTLADVYRYPGQHFDFHKRQLTLNSRPD